MRYFCEAARKHGWQSYGQDHVLTSDLWRVAAPLNANSYTIVLCLDAIDTVAHSHCALLRNGHRHVAFQRVHNIARSMKLSFTIRFARASSISLIRYISQLIPTSSTLRIRYMQGSQEYADPDALQLRVLGMVDRKGRPACSGSCSTQGECGTKNDNTRCEGAETLAPLCTRKYYTCCVTPLRLSHDGRTEVCFGLALPLARMGRGSR